MADIWRKRFEVRSSELDAGGRLSIPALCEYLQEAATGHALDLGISIGELRGRDNLTWVLGKLQLDVDRLPGAGEEVEVTTWPSRLRRHFVMRDFLVAGAGGEEQVRATSVWFVIDVERRKAVHIPSAVLEIRLPERPRAVKESWARLPAPEGSARAGRFTIGRGDLDVNDHVNHVKYLEWALGTLDPEFFSKCALGRLEIDFLAELTYGDSVVTEAQVVDDERGATVLFTVRREEPATEAARIRSVWRSDSSGTGPGATAE